MVRYDNSMMAKLERMSHFAAAVVTNPTNTCVCCIGLLSAARPCGTVPSRYSLSSHYLCNRHTCL